MRGSRMTSDLDHLKSERDRYVAFAFCWGDLLFELEADGTVAAAAGPTEAFLGVDERALPGRSLRDFVAPGDSPVLAEIVKAALNKGRVDNRILRVRTPQGRLMSMAVSGYCLDPASRRLYVALRMQGREGAAAAEAVDRDPETGLLATASFAEMASRRLIATRAAGEDAQMTLVSIPGIEDLGRRLDNRGRQRLKREVSAVLRAGSVAGDSAAQVAEEKFSLVHGAATDVGGLVEQIRALARQADPEGRGVEVNSTTLESGDISNINEEDLAKGLLYAMNRFKDSKGDRFTIHGLSANIGALVGTAAREVTDFKAIVAASQFDVAFQPIIDVNHGDIHHYEALCRFQGQPGDGSPYQYITFAEETGLIHDFDLAMLRKVIDKLAAFPRNSDKYRFAVNVSGHSIGRPEYVAGLKTLLRENLWTRGKLMFEITESARMSDLESANAFIQSLRNWGYEVCLDDFGAGAASFQYLSSLDVDVVKLDGSAVRNSRKAHKGRAFMTALTELCRRLGVKTIAEMIDEPDALDFVRDCGCDYVQGYLFGKPSQRLGDFAKIQGSHLFRPNKRMA